MWKTFKLEDIFKICSSKRVLKSEWRERGVPFYRGREITSLSKYGFVDNDLFISEEHFLKLSEQYGVPAAGDILITAIGTIGNTYITKEQDRFYFKDASVLWLKKIKDVSSEFINYWFRSDLFKKQIEIGNGATVDSLSISKLKSMEISIPTLSEQERIVAKLDSIFCEIDKATQLVDKKLLNNKNIIFSSLRQIFDNEKEKWETNTLNNLCLLERGSSPRPIKRYIRDEGVNWIKIGDTSLDGKYIKSTKQKISKEGSEKSRYVNAGDLVLTNSMSYGRPYIMATDGCIHDGWFVLRLNKDIDTEFFFYLLSSPLVQNQFHRLAAGAVVKNISSDLVKRTLIPLPSKSRQLEIRDKFIKMETYIEDHLNLLKSEKEALISLKSATLSTELRSKKGL